MHFTKVQISELIRKHAEKGNGLHDLMEIMLSSMVVAERGEFMRDNPDNKGNGYRLGHTYGQGQVPEGLSPELAQQAQQGTNMEAVQSTQRMLQ